MRSFSLLLLFLFGFNPLNAEQIPFSKVVKASIVFSADHNATAHYPHVLKVFLRLENTHDSDISWVANSVTGIEADLLDESGKSVAMGFFATSIPSNSRAYWIPYGSRLDWLISHGGVSMVGNAEDKYAIVVGGRGWLVPMKTAGSYSLRIRLLDTPWSDRADNDSRQPMVLLSLPPVKLKIADAASQ